jgi:hypothetical protein
MMRLRLHLVSCFERSNPVAVIARLDRAIQ